MRLFQKLLYMKLFDNSSNIHSIRAKDSHQLKRVSTWLEKGKGKGMSNSNDQI